MKLKHLLFFLPAIGVIIFLAACKDAANIFPGEAAGVLVNYTGCKNSGEKQGIPGNPADQNIQECIEYQYNGENTLLVNHINSVFNCCPGTITADMQFSEGVISIVEKETEHGCKCLCYYDLNYNFTHIPSGTYIIRITCEGGEMREFAINLNTSHSGSKCWERSLY